jgi:hypothetical protein
MQPPSFYHPQSLGRPERVRRLAVIYFLASAFLAVVLLLSSEYREQVTNFGQRLPAINGFYLLLLLLLALVAGIGLLKCWQGGFNLAMVFNLLVIIVGVLVIREGGRNVLPGVLLILASVVMVYHLLTPEVLLALKEGSELSTDSGSEYGGGELVEEAVDFVMGRYGGTSPLRRHSLANALWLVLVGAYGIIYLLSAAAGGTAKRDYTSADNSFKISTPRGWVMADNPQTGAEISLVRRDPETHSIVNQPAVSVYVVQAASASAELEGAELASWQREWMQKAGSNQVPELKPAKVGGISGWRMSLLATPPGGGLERWWLLVTKKDAKLYTLRAACPEEASSEMLTECQKVLNTFRFLS